jgi:hypothetical protein
MINADIEARVIAEVEPELDAGTGMLRMPVPDPLNYFTLTCRECHCFSRLVQACGARGDAQCRMPEIACEDRPDSRPFAPASYPPEGSA